MPSTIIDPVAGALAAKIAAIAVDGTTVKAYKWSPGPTGIDKLPAGVVTLPSLRRTDVDSAEDHLGANDWRVTYEVDFFFDASSASFSQRQAVEVIEAFIVAVDADQDLGGTCQEAKVESAEPTDVVSDHARAMFAYACEVSVLKFV